MNWVAFCIIVILSLLASNLDATHIACKEGEVKVYDYEGGTMLFEKKLENGTVVNQKIVTQTQIKVSCIKHFVQNDNELLLWWIRMGNVTVNTVKPKDAVDSGEVEQQVYSGFAPDILYAQDRRGKVYKLIKSHAEDELIGTTKKNIIELFQTKLEGADCGNRDLSVGTVRVCYKRVHNDKENMFLVEGRARAKHILKVAKSMGNFSPKRDTYEYEHELMIDGDGVVHTANIESKFGAGGDHSEVAENDLHTKFDSQGTNHALDGARDGTPLNGHSISSVSLKSAIPATSARAKTYVKSMLDVLGSSLGSLNELTNFIDNHDDFKFEDLHMSEKFANQLNKKYAKELKEGYNFWKELDHFKQGNAKDTKLYAELHKYLTIVGADHQKLYNYCYGSSTERGNFRKMMADIDSRRSGGVSGDFALSCQGLMIADRSKEGQEMLLESMHLSLPLLEHGMIQFLGLEKPIGGVIRALIEIQKRDIFDKRYPFKISDQKYSLLQHQSYLVLAGVARSLPRSQSKSLLKMYLKHFSDAIETEDTAKTLFMARALQNLGSLVSPGLLHAHATDPNHDVQVQKAFVQAFSTHTSPKTHQDVSKILSAISMRGDMHPSVRAAAVLSQTSREKDMSHIHHGSNMEHYTLLFHNPHTPQEVAHALHHYFQHEGSEDSVRVLQEAEEKRKNFDPDTYVEQVVDAFGGEEEAEALLVGRIKKVIADIKEGLSPARFESMTCLDFARNGDQVCAKKPEMVQFLQDVRRMGSLRDNGRKGESKVFETLFGVNAGNVYIGWASGSYSGLICNNNDASVSFSVFARAHITASLFNSETNILEAYGYLILAAKPGQYPIETGVSFHQAKKSKNAPQPIGSSLHDHVYFALGKSVLIDTHIVSEKARKAIEDCERNQKILTHKVWKNIVQFQFSIPLGPIGALTISGSAQAAFTVTQRFDLCPTRLRANYGIAPRFDLGATISGRVTITAVSLEGIVDMKSRIELKPVFGLFGCKICAILGQDSRPFDMDVKARVSVGFGVTLKLFSFGAPHKKDDIIHICEPLPGVEWAWWENDADSNTEGLEGLETTSEQGA